MLDSAKNILEWVDQYGADKVFMVLFFLMYWKSQRRVAKIQDARLEDSKKAVGALIEARHAIAEAHDVGEEISEEVRKNREENKEEFGRVRGKLDRIRDKINDVQEAVQKN
jgi:gas vesicle protein